MKDTSCSAPELKKKRITASVDSAALDFLVTQRPRQFSPWLPWPHTENRSERGSSGPTCQEGFGGQGGCLVPRTNALSGLQLETSATQEAAPGDEATTLVHVRSAARKQDRTAQQKPARALSARPTPAVRKPKPARTRTGLENARRWRVLSFEGRGEAKGPRWGHDVVEEGREA